MAGRIFEPSNSSDSPVNLMCNNMGFLKNLLSSDFGGHFFIFVLYFMILSPDEIDVLPMVEPRSFAVSPDFGLKPSFYCSILTLYQASAVRNDVRSRGLGGNWRGLGPGHRRPRHLHPRTSKKIFNNFCPGRLRPIPDLESPLPRTSSRKNYRI